MNSKVIYLSSRSLAVYETMLIESFERQLRQQSILQKIKIIAILAGFISAASIALTFPLALH